MKKLGWYFARAENRLGYDDKRPIVIGKTHTVDTSKKPLELCNWGLHASSMVIDALEYAPGPMIYRVELSGTILTEDDKMVASGRTYLWGYDATDILRLFARRCALDVAHLLYVPQVVMEYLKTGNENLRSAARDAAGDVAWDAAWDATWDAAWAAARAAARSAARAAARSAAWDAARSAAGSAAWDAAWAAARIKQNNRLTQMIVKGR